MKKVKIVISFLVTLAAMDLPTAWSQQPIKLKAILEVASSDSNEQLGAYVKGVGDLNHDGYADVAVSAPGIYKTFIYYGGKVMSQTPSLTLEGGGHIASGDFRGNGWIDLAIEKAFHDTVLVYYNGPNGLDTIPDLVLTVSSDYFGSVMTAGDFYGNGYTDLAIGGAFDANNSFSKNYNRGMVFIYSGAPSMNPTPVDTIIGDTVFSGLGIDLASGDVYDSGTDGLIAFGFDQSCGNVTCGHEYIALFYNDNGFHLKRSLYIDSRHVPGGFGLSDGSVACFDADGDGIKDILVSGICIFKGGSKIDTLPTYHVAPPYNDTTNYGKYPWVGGGGDYNGDGIPDILLASEHGVFGVTGGGFVMVDGRGHPGQFAGYRVYSDYRGGSVNLGGTPENAGDVNGEGVDDIIIGNGGWPYTWSYGFFGIYSGDTSMIAAVKKQQAPPKEFKLEQNFPNPFNPTTVIKYYIPRDTRVTLTVYDIVGRVVATLVDGVQSAGRHEVTFDGSKLASGVYFYRLTTPTSSKVMKMLMVK